MVKKVQSFWTICVPDQALMSPEAGPSKEEEIHLRVMDIVEYTHIDTEDAQQVLMPFDNCQHQRWWGMLVILLNK